MVNDKIIAIAENETTLGVYRLFFKELFPQVEVVIAPSTGLAEVVERLNPDLVMVGGKTMPGINGLRLIQMLRKTYQGPIVMGTADQDFGEAAVNLGAKEYFLKPFSVKTFCEVVTKYTDEKPVK